jgi:hypothetical protein
MQQPVPQPLVEAALRPAMVAPQVAMMGGMMLPGAPGMPVGGGPGAGPAVASMPMAAAAGGVMGAGGMVGGHMGMVPGAFVGQARGYDDGRPGKRMMGPADR